MRLLGARKCAMLFLVALCSKGPDTPNQLIGQLADWLSMLSKRWAAGEKKHSDWLFSLIDQCMKRIVIKV